MMGQVKLVFIGPEIEMNGKQSIKCMRQNMFSMYHAPFLDLWKFPRLDWMGYTIGYRIRLNSFNPVIEFEM